MFSSFLTKEFTEVFKTWRIWVVPGMLIFFAVTSPILALITPSLVTTLAGSQPGVVIELPPPVARDAYQQFFKNLNQIVIIAVIIASAGAISGERSSGTAILVLTKPLSRGAFVLAKIVSQQTMLVVVTGIGVAVCIVVTNLLFDRSPVAPFLAGVGLWLLFALLTIVVMTLFSAGFPSRGAAIGAGLGFYFLTLVLAVWPAVASYTFVGLPAAGPRLIAGIDGVAWVWPVVTTALTSVVLAGLAVWVFGKQEL